MNIKNLKTGMIIKNYKELCKLLEIEVKSGNSKNAQLKELAKYVEFRQEGQKFIITKKYRKPKSGNDKRELNKGGNNRVFVDDFVSIVALDLMNKTQVQKRDSYLIPQKEMFKMAQLINNNYREARVHSDALAMWLGMPVESTADFYNTNNQKLKKIVENGLKACRGYGILASHSVTGVCVKKSRVAFNEFNEPIIKNDKVVYEVYEEVRMATKEEVKKILDIEVETRKELDCSSIQMVFLKNKTDRYKKIIAYKLEQYNTNIKYYFDAYQIIINEEELVEFYNKHLKDLNHIDVGDKINKKIMASISKTTRTTHKSALKSDTTFDYARVLNYRRSDTYISDQDKIASILIDINAPSIKNPLETFMVKNEVDRLNKYKDKMKQQVVIEYEPTLDWEEGCFEASVDF